MNRFFTSVVKAVLNYMAAYEPQHNVSFASVRIKHTVYDDAAVISTVEVVLVLHHFVRSGCLRTKDCDVLPLLELLIDSRADGKELGISHLGRDL